MGYLFEEMVGFFIEDDWKYQVIEEEVAIQLNVAGESGNWKCLAKVDEEDDYFCFYSYCPINAPEHKRLEIAEFITRANSGIRIGNFEMDFEDGEIRYKTSISFDSFPAKSKMFENLVYVNVSMMDRYLPGIMRVIYGDIDPQEAVEVVENSSEE